MSSAVAKGCAVGDSGAATRGAAAFFATIFLAGTGDGATRAVAPDVSSFSAPVVAGDGAVGLGTSADLAAADLTAADSPTADSPAANLAAAFLTGLTSWGCWGRVRPSRSARRRTRSACCSIMVEEWVFAPTPRALERSIISALVIPSSLASSCIRMFFDKTSTAFRAVALNRQTGQRLVSCSCSPSSLRRRIGVLRVLWVRVAVSTPARIHVVSLLVAGT